MRNSKAHGKAGLGTVLLIGIVAVVIVVAAMHMSQVDEAKHIQSVLEQNKQFADILISRMNERKTATEEDMERLARYYDEYAAQIRKIDTHECPRDFAEAFYRYVAAYEDEAQVMHEHPHIPSGEEAVAAGVESVLEGDPARPAREFDAEFDAWDKRRREKHDRASRTEQEMKAIAVRRGAI